MHCYISSHLSISAKLVHVRNTYCRNRITQLLFTDGYFFFSKLVDDADNCRWDPCCRKRQKCNGDGLIAGRRPRVIAFTSSIKQTFLRQTKHGVCPIVC